jgi:Fe-Mn family superoxide dismutase
MAFELPKLPFGVNDLEPVITENTINFHFGKHHQAYVTNLNKLIEGTVFESMTLEEIILKSDGGVFNNAAQVWNHTFYWEGFAPDVGGEPTGKIAEMINEAFGSFDEFKKLFAMAGATQFGSGWAWLVLNKDGKLEITKTANAENPMTQGLKPLLTCDVWEHAYYLDYQNRRPDYIADFWKLVDGIRLITDCKIYQPVRSVST